MILSGYLSQNDSVAGKPSPTVAQVETTGSYMASMHNCGVMYLKNLFQLLRRLYQHMF